MTNRLEKLLAAAEAATKAPAARVHLEPEDILALVRAHVAMREALERTQYGMKLAVAGQPFRAMAETLAEGNAALDLARTLEERE